jgi:hypothetical protein
MNHSSDNNDILDLQNSQNRRVKYDSDQELNNHLKTEDDSTKIQVQLNDNIVVKEYFYKCILMN